MYRVLDLFLFLDVFFWLDLLLKLVSDQNIQQFMTVVDTVLEFFI